MDQRDKEEILHIMKNIAQKEIGIRHFREAIQRISDTKEQDLNRIWELIRGDEDPRKINNGKPKTP